MEENKKRAQKVVVVSKKKFLILLGLIIVLIGGGFLVSSNRSGIGVQRGGFSPGAMGVPESARDIQEVPPYYIDTTPDFTDTREFLKTNYSAQVFTRDVRQTVDKVEDIVRKTDGRVDGISSGEKYGSVSFVIPKSNLSEFRDEIEEITHSKLYTEDIYSQNLLNQKQNIEQRTEDTVKSLVELEEEKKQLDEAHAGRLQSLQSQINTLQGRLAEIRAAMQNIDDEDQERLIVLREQETLLEQEISAIQQERVRENQNYSSRRNELTALIDQAGGNLSALSDEDQEFMDNIETVNGYINVHWINWWNVAEKFSPSPMALNLVVLALLVLWLLSWMRIIPKLRIE